MKMLIDYYLYVVHWNRGSKWRQLEEIDEMGNKVKGGWKETYGVEATETWMARYPAVCVVDFTSGLCTARRVLLLLWVDSTKAVVSRLLRQVTRNGEVSDTERKSGCTMNDRSVGGRWRARKGGSWWSTTFLCSLSKRVEFPWHHGCDYMQFILYQTF